MAEQFLPLFPLSLVLLPAMPLPLHIFEDRYKEMMADIIPTAKEFGVVLAQEDGIVNIGCTAMVERVVKRYPDGRLDLLAIGQRRFRIGALDTDRNYLRAEVSYFNDEDVTEVSPELFRKSVAVLGILLQMERSEVSEPPKIDRNRLSFQIAQFIYDLEKRQTVLALRSEVERLEFLLKIVPGYIEKQQRIALARQVGPRNGHAKGF